MVKNKKILQLFWAVTIALVCVPGTSFAQSASSNYRIEESYFGTGGEVDASSTNYRARQSAGSLGVGPASSAAYDAAAGFVTPSEPFLEVFVTGATVSFGTLDDLTTSFGSAQAGTCNCSFTVRSYLSSDYVVVTASQPPTNESGISLTAKSVLGAPSGSQSVEEFGINLVANTTLGTFGANPVNQPDSTFADGKAEPGYDTPNQFKYNVGDVIARSPATAGNPGIGETDYTISYIAKAKSTSKAGFYVMQHTLVVTPTF
jgi:hypothetical protein